MVFMHSRKNAKHISRILEPFSSDIKFLYLENTNTLSVFGMSDAVAATFPTIQASFYQWRIQRSLALFFVIFKSVFQTIFSKDLVSFSPISFDIYSGTPFQESQNVMEKFVIYQQEHVLEPFHTFYRELIPSYLHYLKFKKIHVALVFLSTDGKLSKKFQISKCPFLCGDRNDVHQVIETLYEPFIRRVCITRAGFNKLISNRKFVIDAEKLHSVWIQSFPDFVSITGFIDCDICFTEREIFQYLGAHTISSYSLPRSTDPPMVNVNIPTEWNDDYTTSFLQRIMVGSPEWEVIARLFLKYNRIVLHIDRVTNVHQWYKYSQAKDRFLDLNQDPNELFVYHGTSTTDPSLIYSSPEGLDFRYSNQGFWGRGSYFAEECSLADSFSYHVPQSNLKQIFLFNILAGKMIELDMDNSLTMPPFVHPDLSSIPGERYSTVTGMHPSGRVFVKYTNEGIYPKFLITYFDKE